MLRGAIEAQQYRIDRRRDGRTDLPTDGRVELSVELASRQKLILPVHHVMPMTIVNARDDLLEESPRLVLLQLPVLNNVLKKLST